jgi:hypothetical protein
MREEGAGIRVDDVGVELGIERLLEVLASPRPVTVRQSVQACSCPVSGWDRGEDTRGRQAGSRSAVRSAQRVVGKPLLRAAPIDRPSRIAPVAPGLALGPQSAPRGSLLADRTRLEGTLGEGRLGRR